MASNDHWNGVNSTEVNQPFGAIGLVEPTINSHEKFIRAAEPEWILVKLHHARQLYDKTGMTAGEWAPSNTSVLTTSTIQDVHLRHIQISDEKEIVDNFEPDMHIGGEVSAYRNEPRYRRIDLINRSMTNAIWLNGEVDADTTIVPIIKGITVQEHNLTYRALEYFDHNMAAFYGTQHFTKKGNNIKQLLTELHHIQAEVDHQERDFSLILIGLLAQALQNVPPIVIASSGMNAWLNRINVSEYDDTRIRREWEEINADAIDWLETTPEEEYDEIQHQRISANRTLKDRLAQE